MTMTFTVYDNNTNKIICSNVYVKKNKKNT